MSDYFIHNSKNIIPTYNPGIIGYSQPGAPGDEGISGNSVYYTAFNLTPGSADIDLCVTKILQNNQLSNNYDASIDGVYKQNDLIIDMIGNFYRIEEIKTIDVKISPCYDIEKSGYSEITELFTGFDVFCNTSFLKSSQKKWVQSNPYYISEADAKREQYSPKAYHHNRLEKNIYGNFIKFALKCKNKERAKQYLYKYVIVLPSGRLLEYYSEDIACTVFLENKMLMGEYSRNEGRMYADFKYSDIKFNPEKQDTSTNDLELILEEEFQTKSIFEILNENNTLDKLKSNILHEEVEFDKNNNPGKETPIEKRNYLKALDICYDGLESKEFSIVSSYFIKEECHAYVEITSKETGVVYRIDVTDKFITEDASLNENNVEYIDKVVNTISWKTNTYSYESGLLKYKNENDEICLYNPFYSYVFFTNNDTSDYDVLSSENEEIEYVHFVDSSGLISYLNSRSNFFLNNNGNEFEDETITTGDGDETRVTKYLKMDSSILNRFDPAEIEQEILEHYGYDYEYDITNTNGHIKANDFNRTIRLTFAGVSSISLNIVYQKLLEPIVKSTGEIINYPQALVYIGYPDTPLLELKDPETAGIWYLTKFVPPGYYVDNEESDYVKTSFAGITDTTINLDEFNKNDGKSHFIEIGITLLDMDLGSSRHQINSGHRQSFIKNDDAAEYSIDKYSFLSSDWRVCGTPDLKLFVTRVAETSTAPVSNAEENVEAFFTSIHRDYPENLIID